MASSAHPRGNLAGVHYRAGFGAGERFATCGLAKASKIGISAEIEMLRGNRSTGNLIVAAGLVMMVALAAAAQRSSEQAAQHSPTQTAKGLNAAAPTPNFAHDIAPILFRNCVSCHRPGESAPFSLLNYADANKHAERIAIATSTREMPPWLPAAGYGNFVDE
nr:hypothetical protein [Candidatus Acidoferrales bacterium]